MADPALNIPRMSAKDYLDLERMAASKHEFIDGIVYAMSGTTKQHDFISGDIYAALVNALKPPCDVFSANVKVHIETADAEAYYYPDVHVSCSDLDKDPLSSKMPSLVIEVASDSTADYDRGAKFVSYRKLPSLQEYVIVQQTHVRVEVFRKRTGWLAEVFGAGDTITLESVGVSLPVAQFYRRVKA